MNTNARIVAVSLGTSVLLFGTGLNGASAPLETWAERYVSISVRDVAYGTNLFVALGDGFGVSPDGICWRRESRVCGSSSGTTTQLTVFVAVGLSLATSFDGVAWANQSAGVSSGLRAGVVGADSVVAVGEVGGYYTDHPRGAAAQSGGRPQACLQALGFGPVWDPGFRLLLTAEQGRSYRLQSSPQLPAASWTDVGSVFLPSGSPGSVMVTDHTASDSGQRFYRVVCP